MDGGLLCLSNARTKGSKIQRSAIVPLHSSCGPRLHLPLVAAGVGPGADEDVDEVAADEAIADDEYCISS